MGMDKERKYMKKNKSTSDQFCHSVIHTLGASFSFFLADCSEVGA
jgi:hypothetical protein